MRRIPGQVAGQFSARTLEYLGNNWQANLFLLCRRSPVCVLKSCLLLCAAPPTGPWLTCWIVNPVSFIGFSKLNHFWRERCKANWQVKFRVQSVNIEGFTDRQTFRMFQAAVGFDFGRVLGVLWVPCPSWLGRACRNITPVSVGRFQNGSYFWWDRSQGKWLVIFQLGHLNI